MVSEETGDSEELHDPPEALKLTVVELGFLGPYAFPEAPQTICPLPQGRAPLYCVLAPH